MSYTLHVASKSILDTPDSVTKCLIDSLSVLFEVLAALDALVLTSNEDRPRIEVAESQPWSVAEWAVALRFDNPRATVQVLLLG